MNLELNDVQARGADRELHCIIQNDRYPLSPRIVALKEILAQLRPEPERERLSPRRHYEPPREVGIGDGGRTMVNNVKFALRFPPSEIPEWALQYNAAEDDDALAAGRRIANGAFDPRNDLAIIFKWKTRNRGKSRLLDNTREEISDALELAVRARTERSAVAVLTGLSGIATPVASAILTAIDPERYTIIDFRALGALNYNGLDRSLPFYLHYLRYCRATARKHRVNLRTLDRALWQWSYVNQPNET